MSRNFKPCARQRPNDPLWPKSPLEVLAPRARVTSGLSFVVLSFTQRRFFFSGNQFSPFIGKPTLDFICLNSGYSLPYITDQQAIECFHVTSGWPCCCTHIKKWRPWWCTHGSSLISIPQTDISFFIQLTRCTIYFRLQIYFNETNILNKLRTFTIGEAKSWTRSDGFALHFPISTKHAPGKSNFLGYDIVVPSKTIES